MPQTTANVFYRLKEKAMRSNFPLHMTNVIITMSSTWEKTLRSTKCDKKDDPLNWVTPFSN